MRLASVWEVVWGVRNQPLVFSSPVFLSFSQSLCVFASFGGDGGGAGAARPCDNDINRSIICRRYKSSHGKMWKMAKLLCLNAQVFPRSSLPHFPRRPFPETVRLCMCCARCASVLSTFSPLNFGARTIVGLRAWANGTQVNCLNKIIVVFGERVTTTTVPTIIYGCRVSGCRG